jgi:hypothetical protein
LFSNQAGYNGQEVVAKLLTVGKQTFSANPKPRVVLMLY